MYVLDEPDAIRRKFKRAVTDSGTEIVRGRRQAGDPNLIEILAVVRGVAPEAVERDFAGRGYGEFKTAVGDAVADWLAPVRERYARAARRRGGARGDPRRPAPRRRGRSPSGTLADVRDGDGRRARSAADPPGRRLACAPVARSPSPRAGPRRLRGPVRPAARR